MATISPAYSSVVPERNEVGESEQNPCTPSAVFVMPSPQRMPMPNKPPVAVVTPSFTRILVEERAVLSARESCDPDGSITDYRWSFGPRATLFGPEVTLMFTEPGSQSVVLTVEDDDGGKDSTIASIEVLPQTAEPVLILSMGPDNMLNLREGTEGIIVLDMVVYNQPASNVAVEILDDGGLDISVEDVPKRLKPGTPAELCVRIEARSVGKEATGSVVLLRIVSDEGMSNVERIDVMVQPPQSSESLSMEFIEWLAVVIGFAVVYFLVEARRKKR